MKRILGWPKGFWQRSIWHKILMGIVVVIGLWVAMAYSMSQYYVFTHQDRPLVAGSSFVPAYAESLDLDPKKTMDAMIGELGIRHFRLVSYWDRMEKTEGTYDFSELDWQFEKAEAANAKVTLSLGLRQPRWPECHMPAWAMDKPLEQWQPQLLDFMTAVVNRYKGSPALDSYQVENEFFLRGFGECTDFTRERLVAEYDLVKKLDPAHKIIVARSNNALGWPAGKPTPDVFGVSVYKRVWDSTITKRYVEYPFPAWFYGFLAQWQLTFVGPDMILHELQAEAWPPHGQKMQLTSLEEQNKSFDAERFKHRLNYAKGTGIREMYLWSGEYWYYRKVHLNDESLWNIAKDFYAEANATEASASDPVVR